jgi:hypothetical protein
LCAVYHSNHTRNLHVLALFSLKNQRIFLFTAVLLAVASASLTTEKMSALQQQWREYRCTRCQDELSIIHARSKATATTQETCELELKKSCVAGLNATAHRVCHQAVAKLCKGALLNTPDFKKTCESVHFCDANADPIPEVGKIWGECGTCQVYPFASRTIDA